MPRLHPFNDPPSHPSSAMSGTHPDPSQFPRRVLLAVTGLSPQIVTETLFALATRKRDPWIPTEIHLITTAEGAERARLSLLHPKSGWFLRLCRDYGLPSIRFDTELIRELQAAAGMPLTDIRTLDDNTAAADAITEQVRILTADPHAALHVSIAGGRKTMGFYLGYALSLYGRPQDRLSHVLVSAPYESHPQFFYPTPESDVIHTPPPDSRPYDTRDARVTL
uniref:CRISPR-associated ring nuclease Csm6 n=1 Tax=Thiocapsa sp. TaxID=2024551 RepID=UPI00359318F9